MDTIQVSPAEIEVTVLPSKVNLTVEPTDVILEVSPTEINLNLTPTEVDLTLTPSEVNLTVLSGAVINNTYTTGGKLTLDFDYSDFGASVLIGEIELGRVIVNTVIEVDTAFDSGSFTIGKDSAQAYLMTIADRGNAVNRYLVHNYIELTTTDNYKIYFSGSPTQGSGKVYITYL